MIWRDFEAAAPELARLGRERLARPRVALLGTLREDGSPRINPVEPYFVEGHLLLGLMARSKKALDLLRDSRYTLHSAVSSPDAGESEFKLYGQARSVEDPDLLAADPKAWWTARPPETARVFTLEIENAALVEWELERGEMTVTRWSPRRGAARRTSAYP